MTHDFLRVAAGVPRLKPADCRYNVDRIERMMIRAAAQGADIIAFPRMAITGSTCGDLFLNKHLITESVRGLVTLVDDMGDLPIVGIVGILLPVNNRPVEVAAVFQSGEILGFVADDTSDPGLRSQEMIFGKWAIPAAPNLMFRSDLTTFTVTFGDDLLRPMSVSGQRVAEGANVLFHLDAMPTQVGRHDALRDAIRVHTRRCIAGCVYVSAGHGESSTDHFFDGEAFIADRGRILAESTPFTDDEPLIVSEVDIEAIGHDRRCTPNFSVGMLPSPPDEPRPQRFIPFDLHVDDRPLLRPIHPHPFVPADTAARDRRCEETFRIQSHALAERLRHIGLRRAVIGISGGLDSTLALMVTIAAFDLVKLPHEGIIGVTMPGFGTSDRTHDNALALMTSEGITLREISIRAACEQHFRDIGHDGSPDTTYENVQARERTQILMDLANMEGALVVGTGDLSELALGWCTFNGDHMSMYGVNAGVPKTLVRAVVRWLAGRTDRPETRRALLDIAETPISPELLPPSPDGSHTQQTEHTLGPYELHDFFLYRFMRFGDSPRRLLFLAEQAFADRYTREELLSVLHTFLRRFFAQQFKRNCMPDGPAIGSISLSPRGAWRMPSDASADLWLREVEELERTMKRGEK